MDILKAIILAIIEGITEFLPISSTGHMVVASTLLGIANFEFTKLYIVAIQLGAILSVIVLYWNRFFQSVNFYYKLIIAFIPAVILGLLFSNLIDELLENAYIVAIMLILGGIIFLFVDKWFNQTDLITENEHPSNKQVFTIGLYQCIAMIPGVSRSAATIIGGISQKFTRKAAAEFSFFLAVPTMFAATAKKMFDYFQDGNLSFGQNEIKLLVIGNIVAFLIALFAIKAFIGFLTKNGFKYFGYYRIIVGFIILGMLVFGLKIEI